MALYSAQDNIFIRRGDSGNIDVSGLPTDQNYGVYFSVVDENENILKEWVVYSDQQPQVTFSLSAPETDQIPEGDYYYGIKICNNGMEDTLIPRTAVENGAIKRYPAPLFTVGEKYVEGV